MRFAHKLSSFAIELVKLGWTIDTDDMSWRHPNGGFMSVEAIEDMEKYWGKMMVARALDFLELHEHKRCFSIYVEELEHRGGVGFTLKFRVHPQSLLEQLAIAAAD